MSKKQPPESGNPDIRRRKILKGIAAAAGSAALPGLPDDAAAQSLPPLPVPEFSGIDHIVVVMMENRSFDHMLGWVPGADGRQAGLQYPDRNGVMRSTFRLATDPAYGYQGCDKEDPSHSYSGGRRQFNGGAMDGFLKTVSNADDLFAIGYYTADDVPFFKGAAEHFTICDRYFTGILSSTYPNRVYMHAGQTDRNSNTLPYVEQPPSQLPNIWQLLQAKGRKGRYYYNDLPVVGLWGAKYMQIGRKYEQFLVDAAIGNLADVSFIDPFFGAGEGASMGVSRDDHPHADIRDGQAFLNQVYNALRNGPRWDKTLLIINYDEWGGFYDHVAPPVAPVSAAEFAATGNDGRLGFRVPCVLLGPRVRRKHVSHLQFDPNSILNLIRWRFRLGPLSVRDNTSLNMAYALDFASPPKLFAPRFDFVESLTGFGKECSSGLRFPLPHIPTIEFLDNILDPVQRALVEHKLELRSLLTLARNTGWPV